jgi:hypothetical protein
MSISEKLHEEEEMSGVYRLINMLIVFSNLEDNVQKRE